MALREENLKFQVTWMKKRRPFLQTTKWERGRQKLHKTTEKHLLISNTSERARELDLAEPVIPFRQNSPASKTKLFTGKAD